MKIKIIAAVFSIIVLCTTTNIWFEHQSKLNLQFNKTSEITLSYRKKVDSKILVLKQKADKNGKASFKLKGGSVSWFKVETSNNALLKEVIFRGWKKKMLLLTNNEYTGKDLKGRIHIVWFKFIILGILSYLTALGTISAFKSQNQKDIEKLPKMMNLEFLRIVFTFGVVWCHLVPKFQIWNVSWLSVEFFFILGGFLLVLSFHPERKVFEFIRDKWIRFAPLTLFGGMLYLLFEDKINGTRLFADVFFYARSGIYNMSGYYPPAWYLSVLMIVMLFYFYIMKTLKKEVVNIIIAVIAFFASVYVVNYGDKVIGVINGRLMRGFACIGLGYFLAEIYRLLQNREVLHQRAYNVVETIVFTFAILNIFFEPLYMGRVVVCLGYMGIILLFALRKGYVSNFFEKPIFARLARYCLAVYLTHWIICYNILNLLYAKHKEQIISNSTFSIMCILLASLLLGIFAHHAIEKPATKVLRKWLK